MIGFIINESVLAIMLLSFSVTDLKEIYTSMRTIKVHMADTRQLLKGELSTLRSYVKNQKAALTNLKESINNLQHLSEEAKHPNFDILHPLNAYRFIRNHSVIYENTVKTIITETKQLEEKLVSNTRELIPKIPSLNKTEYEGVIDGILRLQGTYDLNVNDIVEGNFGGIPSGLTISAKECGEIIKVLFKDPFNRPFYGSEWVKQATRMIQNGDRSTTVATIYTLAANAMLAINKREEAALLYAMIPKDQRGRYHKIMVKALWTQTEDSNRRQVYRRMNTIFTKADLKNRHDRLCNGQSIESLLPNRHTPRRHLVCRIVDNGSPILRVQPIKLEELSLDPYVAIFHDIGSEHEISAVRECAEPKLQRSMVNSLLQGSVLDRGRTSQNMFIFDDSKYIKFARRIEAATGLNYSGFEKFQIANYGVGGHYYCHHDFFSAEYAKKTFDDDNRIATCMLYLTDVEKGGATVFPDIGVSVFPRKGRAIFWYNMYRNGTVHPLTRHAACPVLVGEKWVGNLWIRRNAQTFAKPCSLDRLELDWNWL
ncbi:prolyl 4-hydroxylase subunit alpha-1-like [Mya arenaria]|uniref:prolyl 4-hydroxylase subunit alpha-1-like n=1 Tax=Mya arenaria TaxID=6604 RepID=UPI0022E01F9C|nr:prolyl 4-hydroxylase subunit alpha-1-like [Mya arenaria]